MDRISRMLQNAGPQGGSMAAPTSDAPQVDTAEQISISSLALLKMLKHGASWPVDALTKSCRSCTNSAIKQQIFVHQCCLALPILCSAGP